MPDTYVLTNSMLAAGTTISGTSSQSAGSQAIINDAITIGTDTLFAIAFPFANVKSLVLLSTVAITIETNSASAPDDTIALAANTPLTWDDSMPYDCPFTADVDGFYVTSAATGTLKVYVLYDPTT